MANTPQARKRSRQAEKRRAHNTSLRSRFRTHVKNVVKAIESGDQAAALESYRKAVPVIDGMASKGIVHKNRAARNKSRLHARIRQMSA